MHGPATLPLPSESTPAASTRGTLRVVAAVLALLVLANLALALALHAWEQRNDPHVLVTAGKRAAIIAMSPRPDLLVIGDSSGRFGADAAVLAAAAGGTGFNACAFGDLLLLNNLWMLEDLAAAGALPRTVVLVHTLDLWPREASTIAPWLDLAPDWRDRLRRLGVDAGGSTSRRLRALAGRWLPLARDSHRARRMLDPFHTDQSRAIDLPSGHQLIPPDPERVRRGAASYAANLAKRPWQVTEVNRKAMAALLALCAKHGVEVRFAHAPTVDVLARDPGFIAGLAAANAWLAGLEAAHPHFRVLRRDVHAVRAERMQNPDHLADLAAIAEYSQALAAGLAATARQQP
jgi:hypothetical protein